LSGRSTIRRYGVTVLGALGFENAYTLAMRGERAGALGLRTIADLTPLAPRLALGSDLEFLSRPEWAALRNAYGLAFGEEKSFNPTFMYRAIQDGLADVISAFSSDGRLAGDALVTLEDVRHAIPSYDAVILIAPKRADDEVLRGALAPLIGAIPSNPCGQFHARPRYRQGVARRRRSVPRRKLEIADAMRKRRCPKPGPYCRVTAMRMMSPSGIGMSLPSVQVGAASYSAGGMLREAI